MKKPWWKLLSVIILIYVFVAGLLIPLKSGVTEVTPSSIRSGGNFQLKIKGYNTHFTKDFAKTRIWLKYKNEYPNKKEEDNDWAIRSTLFAPDNDNAASVGFYIPQFNPDSVKVKDATLIIDHPTDGTMVLPSALMISQDSINTKIGRTFWQTSKAELTALHSEKKLAFPFRNILSETIRNLFFHVPLWFGMMILFAISVVNSWKFLKSFNTNMEYEFDRKAVAYTKIGTLFGILGLITGAIWAKNTWGAYWNFDVKQNMSAICLLIYGAYFVLRNSFEDEEKQARIAAVYNIFAFAAMIPLLFVIPRLTSSLHPGNGGNPGLGADDLDNTMRLVFYPAIIGWTLLGVWMATLTYRAQKIIDESNNE